MNTAQQTTFVSPAVISIMERLEVPHHMAEVIAAEQAELRARGLRGERPLIYHRGHDLTAFLRHVATSPIYAAVDSHDLAEHLRYAWLDGITRPDRLVVELDSTALEAVCERCNATLGNDADECDACGNREVLRYVLATVQGPYLKEWTDAEPYIEGASWEVTGDRAVVHLADHPELVANLRDEGYLLNLTHYATHDDEDEE